MTKRAKPTERERALACLAGICCDGEAKESDRIAAAKLLLEYGSDAERGDTVTVTMEGIPKEYLT